MKRSTLTILLLAVALAALATWLMLRSGNSLRHELRDFAVEDTASVTKIFLADRNKHTILLERKGPGAWTLNGKEPAQQKIVVQLLTTIHHVSVRTRVAKTMYNFVLKDLAATGIKCEIYTGNSKEPLKTYYVGGPTQDNVGTFMMLEGSSVPFVTEVPGFNGYLTPRYNVDLNVWRERFVFAEDPAAITELDVDYPSAAGSSFHIKRTGTSLQVTSADGRPLQTADTTALSNYLDFFRELPFEDWDQEFTAPQRDSLAASVPLAVIRVSGRNGTTQAVLHHKPITKRSLTQQDEKGNPIPYDLDRMYAFIRGGKELVVIQYFSFGKVLRKLEDFDATKRKQAVR